MISNKKSGNCGVVSSSSSSTTSMNTGMTKPSSDKQRRNENSKSKQEYLVSSLLAGMGSGIVSSIVCAPLDLIRTRMQVLGNLCVGGVPTTKMLGNGESIVTPPTKTASMERAAATATATATSSTPKARMMGLIMKPEQQQKQAQRKQIGGVKGSIAFMLRDVAEKEGIRGWFRGLGAALGTVPLFWGLYFTLYESVKDELHQRTAAPSPHSHIYEKRIRLSDPAIHMISAITAGAAADVFCNPMFVVRTRLQTEALHYMELPMSERKPHSLLRTIQMLYAEGGIPIFWRGLTASLMGLAHVAIQFPVYERLKAEARTHSKHGQESPFDLLLASALSKMSATLITYPHEVVRSRMMDARHNTIEGRLSALGTFKQILHNEGYTGLYRGMHVSLIRVIPNCSITFVTYELILRWARQHLLAKRS